MKLMHQNIIAFMVVVTLCVLATAQKKPFKSKLGPQCSIELTTTAACEPCTLSQWAQKIRSLKERPVQFSSLPSKKEYQKNILTLKEYTSTLQMAATVVKKQLAPDKIWLGTKSLASTAPEIFNIHRPAIKPAIEETNFLFKPYAQRLIVPENTQLALFGDLHGSIHSFIRDLEKLRDEGYIDNNFKILKKNFYIIFFGDYIDRGIYGVEVVYTLTRLLITNPSRVILVRGNHEDYLLAPSFRKKRTKEEEKDNAPSFIDELYLKFDLTEEDEVVLFRFYEVLPPVLYLGCGTKKHHDFMQCCHGGLELGYNPYELLHAPSIISYQEIKRLWRKDNFNKKLSRTNQDNIKLAFSLDTLCADIRNYVPTQPFIEVKGTDHKNYIGFMWNDFYVDPSKTVGQRGHSFTGWVIGRELAKNILSWGDSPQVTLRGIFRAHQHNNETGGPMLSLLCCSKGIANFWKGDPMYTLVSAPDSKLDDSGEKCFTYDSFVILTTAKKFENWHMKHYFQDSGMENMHWQAKLINKDTHKEKIPMNLSRGRLIKERVC